MKSTPTAAFLWWAATGGTSSPATACPVEKSFRYDAQSPTLRRAREITAKLLDLFDRGEISKLFVIYTDLGNGVDMDVRTVRLLPLEDEHFAKEETGRKAHPL